MRSRTTVATMLGTAALAVLLAAPPAHAQLSDSQIKCFKAIGKAGKTYVKSVLKTKQKCITANLKKGPGTCPAEDQAKLDKAKAKLDSTLAKACTFGGTAASQIANLANMSLPGPCSDPTPATGFTLADLQACIYESHDAIVAQLIALEYDSTLATLTEPLDSGAFKCQQTVAKEGAKHVDCVLKVIQKCRNAIMSGKIEGILPDNCVTDDPKTAAAHDKCQAKMLSAITSKCSDEQTTALKLCEPDQTLASEAAQCEHEEHMVRTDSPAIDIPADLIDYQYATRSGICGDGVRNSLDEECDGADDADCPDACGSAQDPDGFFACLCKTNHRERVVEHFNADLDNGWSGQSHDSGIVEGGGYVADLYDCDVNGDCVVGPSCSDAPHSPCAVPASPICIGGSNQFAPCAVASQCPGGTCVSSASGTTGDSICAALGQGTCRKTRVAVGPHCYKDIQKKCNPKLASDPTCDALGDYCVKTVHGPPLPLSSGGVSVCIVNQFSEDIVGTTNLLAGTSAVRLRQNSLTHSSVTANAPCPLCGGFCQGDLERCNSNADCAPNQGPCRMDLVCNRGPNQFKPCRLTPPFGGDSVVFGKTSIDCPPFPGDDISSKGLDILFNPTTTGVTTWTPTYTCNAEAFSGNACFGGTSEGRPCTQASECPGGSCSPQCYCPSNIGAPAQQPNACEPACQGGANDAQPCAVDSECPDGFCHLADCRLNSEDTASCQEGECTTGPYEGHCSTSIFQGCSADAACAPPICKYCETGETCIFRARPCFVNTSGGEGLKRCGTPGVVDRKTGTLFCIPGSSSTSVNNVAGIPGPGAITNPVTVIECPGANCDCPGGHCPP